MNRPLEVTEEQVAAAQLRVVLDNKLGRQTPDVIRRIAEMTPDDAHAQQVAEFGDTKAEPATEAGYFRAPSDPTAIRFSPVARPGGLPVAAGYMARAERLYRQAADAGDIGATANLANLAAVLAAVGDTARAERLYRQAADAGDISAMANLAALLVAAGRAEEAEEWLHRAASDM